MRPRYSEDPKDSFGEYLWHKREHERGLLGDTNCGIKYWDYPLFTIAPVGGDTKRGEEFFFSASTASSVPLEVLLPTNKLVVLDFKPPSGRWGCPGGTAESRPWNSFPGLLLTGAAPGFKHLSLSDNTKNIS